MDAVLFQSIKTLKGFVGKYFPKALVGVATLRLRPQDVVGAPSGPATGGEEPTPAGSWGSPAALSCFICAVAGWAEMQREFCSCYLWQTWMTLYLIYASKLRHVY